MADFFDRETRLSCLDTHEILMCEKETGLTLMPLTQSSALYIPHHILKDKSCFCLSHIVSLGAYVCFSHLVVS